MLKKHSYKIAIIIFSFLLLTLLGTRKTLASDFSITDALYKIEIDKNGNATGELDFKLKNISKTKRIINSYNLFLPFKDAGGIRASFNGKNIVIQSKADSSKSYYKVDLFFGNNIILYNASARIKVKFTLFQLLKRVGDFKFVKIGDALVDDQEKFKNIDVVIPQDIGEPTHKTTENIASETKKNKLLLKIRENESRAVVLGWGDKLHFTLNSNFNLNNSEDSSKQFVFQLIPNDSTQKVVYNNLEASYGLYDDLGNNFATVDLEKDSEKAIEFSAIIEKNNSIADFVVGENNLKPDYAIDFWRNAKTNFVDNFDGKLEKLKKFYTSIIRKYKPSKELAFDFEKFEGLWPFIDKAKSLNSVHYSYILKTFCSELQINCEINYGYRIFPTDKTNAVPNFWVKAQIDDKKYILDPFSEQVTGVNGFTTSELDRVKVGVWNNSQSYNNALGLIGKDNKLQTVEIKFNSPTLLGENDPKIEEDFEVQAVFPTKVFSGFYYEAKLKIKNNSSKVYKLTDVKINNNLVETELKSYPDLNYLVLPHVENTIALNGLRESNFFSYGEQSLSLLGVLSDGVNETKINKTVNVNLQLHDGAWIIIVIAFNIAIIASIYSIWKFYLKKKL